MLTVEMQPREKAVVWNCEGELDLTGVAELRECLIEARQAGHYRLVLNMAGITEVQSAVLSYLFTPIRALIAVRGVVVLCEIAETIHEGIEAAEFYPLIRHFATEAEAMDFMDSCETA